MKVLEQSKNSMPGKLNVPPKKCTSGIFFGTSSSTTVSWHITQCLRRENPPTPTTTALGVHYYGFRFYSTDLGRWINRDPLGAEDGANEYQFIGNRPVLDIDALGLESCKTSRYVYKKYRPLKDRDLWNRQTLTVKTHIYVGPASWIVTRLAVFKELYGLTVTEPAIVGADCCCENSQYHPRFEIELHSQIYLLHKDAPAWEVDHIETGDSDVDNYWHYAPGIWYRRHLAMKHERKHEQHGKKNYKKWKSRLQLFESSNAYDTYRECLLAADAERANAWVEFNTRQKEDSDALHGL